MSEREELESGIKRLEEQRAQFGDIVVDTALAALNEKLRNLKTPRESREPGESSGVRRQVTVVFIESRAFDALPDNLAPEDRHSVTEECFKRIEETVTQFGGSIRGPRGEALMAVWGVAAADERDPENAVHAALKIRQAMEEMNGELQSRHGISLPLRLGVNTGLINEPRSGGSDRAISGLTVDVARAIGAAAPAGNILISHDTYRQVRGVFAVAELEPITIKGVLAPVPVYLVEREKHRVFRLALRGVEGIETPMVGRDSEMAGLQAAFQDTVRNRCLHMVTVTGEAGVGKSRLLYEFTKWLELRPEIMRFFKGGVDRPTGLSPYALMKEVFSDRFEIRDDDSPESARRKFERGVASFVGPESQAEGHYLGHLLGFDFSTSPHVRSIINEPQQFRDRAFSFASQLLDVAGRGAAGAALFLEDLHWADDGSLDLVQHLATARRATPLLIVCVARPTLFERRPNWCKGPKEHLLLHLKPLDREQSHKLVTEILCRLPTVPHELEDIVVGQSEGVPFYLEEFIKMLIEEGVILKGSGSWELARGGLSHLRVPPTLTGVLQARLDGLSKEEKEALQTAAVIGRVFWDRALAHVGPEAGRHGRHETSLRVLQEKELVYERAESTFSRAREYSFKHPLLYDVAYESVPKHVRQRYHAQVATWLIAESGDRGAQLAGLIGEHFEKAGEFTKASVWYGTAGVERRKRTHLRPQSPISKERSRSFPTPPGQRAKRRGLPSWRPWARPSSSKRSTRKPFRHSSPCSKVRKQPGT